jgi:DNA repair photolyase
METRGGRRHPLRRRAALSNRSGRFERIQTLPLDATEISGGEAPGWAAELDQRPTRVTAESIRSILTANGSPDVPFDRSVNPYRGCEHGCIYCFARPTHAFLGLSPGLDFETRIFSKPLAPQRLAEELARPSYRCQVVALGANTDPYQPIERKLHITRRILEVFAECRHPVSIVTKSDLVVRDLDLLAPMARARLASVYFSLTTLDPELARRMEPRAPRPERRLSAIRALTDEGVPVGVLASPMIPGLNDAELERILEAGARAGATTAGYILIRLPGEVEGLFREWLETHYPHKAAHVLSLIRQTRGGKLYRSEWGERMRGEGPYAELLERRFALAVRRFALEGRPALDLTQFRPPPARGQLPLF